MLVCSPGYLPTLQVTGYAGFFILKKISTTTSATIFQREGQKQANVVSESQLNLLTCDLIEDFFRLDRFSSPRRKIVAQFGLTADKLPFSR